MFKYLLAIVVALALVLVAVTVGANNNQIISFNYIVAQGEFKLSTLVAILFGLGFILGWLVTGIFYLKLKVKNMSLMRQIKRQTQKVNELTASLNKAA